MAKETFTKTTWFEPRKKSKLAERTKPVSCKRLLTLIPEVTEIIIAAIGMNVPCNRL